MRRLVMTLPVMLVALGLCLPAQTASKGAEPPKPTTMTMQVQSDLNQLMRGVLYPAANVVFFAQTDNPADVIELSATIGTPDARPSRKTFPNDSSFDKCRKTSAER